MSKLVITSNGKARYKKIIKLKGSLGKTTMRKALETYLKERKICLNMILN